MKLNFKIVAILLFSIFISNVAQAEKTKPDKEFENFWKEFDVALNKKDIKWLTSHTYSGYVSMDQNGMFDRYSDNFLSVIENGQINKLIEKLTNNPPYKEFLNDSKILKKYTIINFKFDDYLYGIRTCSRLSENNVKLSDLFPELSNQTEIIGVRLYKKYKEGGSIETGYLITKINGKFVLIGRWDCSIG